MANRNMNQEGVGLGLSLSLKIANTMGGEIKVKSVVNEGSIFTLIFPIPSSGLIRSLTQECIV